RLECLLSRVQDRSPDEHINFFRRLSDAAQEIRLESSAVMRSFREKKSFVVGKGDRDAWKVWADIPSDTTLGAPFVCSPIAHGNNILGVLVADNLFLNHEFVINPELIVYLEAFAALCAVSLSSAQQRIDLTRDLGDTRRNILSIVRAQSSLELERFR